MKKSLLRHHSAYCEIPTHFFGFNVIIVIISLGLIPAVQYFCLGKIKAVPMTEVAIKKENTAFILQCVVLPSQTSNLALTGTIIKTMRLRLQSDVLGSMLAWCLLFLFFLLGIILIPSGGNLIYLLFGNLHIM